jgi:hypothetical protein
MGFITTEKQYMKCKTVNIFAVSAAMRKIRLWSSRCDAM